VFDLLDLSYNKLYNKNHNESTTNRKLHNRSTSSRHVEMLYDKSTSTTTHTTVLRPFFRDYPRVSRCQKKSFSALFGARKDKQRQTHRSSGWAPLYQRPTSITSPIFMPDALPAATLPLHPGLGPGLELPPGCRGFPRHWSLLSQALLQPKPSQPGMLFIPGSGLHSALPNVPRNFRSLASIPNYTAWRRGVVASVVRRLNEVTLRQARLVLGWVTVFGRVYHHGMEPAI